METSEKTHFKKGLIMEGGAMRGLFTCGVLDVLMENGIEFDGAAGVSAGAVFGCNVKSRQIGRAVRYNKKYCRDPRYSSLRSLITTGNLFGVDFCYREIPEVLDPFDAEAFRENPMKFYVTATDVLTGETVSHQCVDGGPDDITWMRASASMPIVSRPVRIGGYVLLDGGISESVPCPVMERAGYNRNVIVLTQPADYIKQKASGISLMRILLRNYPKIADAMAVRHERYNQQMKEIREQEAAGKVLVIRPPEDLRIGRTEKNPAELERVYQIGRRETERRLSEIKTFLNYGNE